MKDDQDEIQLCAASSNGTVAQHQEQIKAEQEALSIMDSMGIMATMADLGYTPENSNMASAFVDAIERGRMYNQLEHVKAAALRAKGKEPYPCWISVCPRHDHDNDGNRCRDEENCHGCLHQTLDPPPNSLNYVGYMPSHREALDMLEQQGLLKSGRQSYIEAAATWGTAATQEEREQAEVKGITMAQAEAAILRALLSWANNEYCRRDDGDEFCDGLLEHAERLAINATLNLEKVMGIYPNIKLT